MHFLLIVMAFRHGRGTTILIVLTTVDYMIVHALFQLVSVLFIDLYSTTLTENFYFCILLYVHTVY